MQKPSQDIFVVHHASTFGTFPRHHARTDYECYLFFLCLRHVCRCSSIATVWVRQGRRWGHSRANSDHLQVFSGLSLRLHLAVTVLMLCKSALLTSKTSYWTKLFDEGFQEPQACFRRNRCRLKVLLDSDRATPQFKTQGEHRKAWYNKEPNEKLERYQWISENHHYLIPIDPQRHSATSKTGTCSFLLSCTKVTAWTLTSGCSMDARRLFVVCVPYDFRWCRPW